LKKRAIVRKPLVLYGSISSQTAVEANFREFLFHALG
jgi:hypothetical protein